jgi:hypothetical protein
MKRILVLLSVVALMVVTVAPAFAIGGGKENNWGHWCEPCGNHGGGNAGVGN